MPPTQPELLSEEAPAPGPGAPVTCLGMTFADETARRAYFTDRLREHLQDPAFRAIEGFPIGTDEDILALSDPPYYTACPNPFLPEIIADWSVGRTVSPTSRANSPTYKREPFAADVSEGKNDPIYNAHSYHTKVPHKAIMRYILHYTEPGDIVLDGFCGTGMTGVAAQLCGDRAAVQSLGYWVDDDGIIYESANRQNPISRLGPRKAVLTDLSPVATFIAYNYNTPVDAAAFEREVKRILKEVEKECGWMYATTHTDGKPGTVNFTVWSDVFVCPHCNGEMIFWDVAVDAEAGAVRDDWPCPHCAAQLSKSPKKASPAQKVERATDTRYDRALGQSVRQAKQVPVLINYSVGKKRHEKHPDTADLALIRRIEESDIPYWFPANRMPEGDESRRNDDIGMTHVHHFYTKRNLWVLSAFSRLAQYNPNRFQLMFVLTSAHQYCLRLCRLHIGNYFHRNGGVVDKPLDGTLYMPSISVETNACYRLSLRSRLSSVFSAQISSTIVQTQSSTTMAQDSTFVDYIFIDPPFGGNLMYSELNCLWEAWVKVKSNNDSEAIINRTQRKNLLEYQELMEQCFREFYRILRQGRWMTIEFHNSKNAVWNAIQEALMRAGFVVADVRSLDKGKGTFKQVTTTAAVKQDLIISAYKPTDDFQQRFLSYAGTAEGVWEFVRQHLAHAPVVVPGPDGRLETVAERQNFLLFDRMVAYHIQRGVAVPMGAAHFYAGLERSFVQRDGMYFLPDQVAAYDRARLEAAGVAQLVLFVSDEKSALHWLRQRLAEQPHSFQEIQPRFLRELHQARHEELPDLRLLLEENFLQDEAGRWYVPDPNRAEDLEKLRSKALLREFETYKEGKKKLRQFRTEAMRAGFAAAWRAREYAVIVAVAERLPEQVLQEDEELVMYYDNARNRSD